MRKRGGSLHLARRKAGGERKKKKSGLSSSSPVIPGLSHVSEHIEEVDVVPSGTLELGPEGYLCVGLSAGDVEGQALEDGEVCGAIVLAVSGKVIVEQDVEWPVQAVLDGPMLAH